MWFTKDFINYFFGPLRVSSECSDLHPRPGEYIPGLRRKLCDKRRAHSKQTPNNIVLTLGEANLLRILKRKPNRAVSIGAGKSTNHKRKKNRENT